MPAITVVVTAYRLETCMACCLDELLAQTMQDFNVLVVDDCSPDGTVEIVRGYQSRYPDKIHALFLPCNTGSPARARNAALDSGMIDGEHVVFLDGDDHIESNFLEVLFQAVKENDADIAICAYDRIDAGTGRILCHELEWLKKGIQLPPKDDAAGFLNSALWNKLIRTEKIAEMRLPDFRVGEDLCFSLRILSKCQRVACVPNELIHYKIWNGSVMTTTRPEDGQAFAEELAAMYRSADEDWKHVFALVSFLHIGLSIPLRMALSKNVRLRNHLQSTRGYMKKEFGLYRSCRFLKLRSLSRRGLKGVAIWFCVIAYRCRCFLPILLTYRAFSQLFRFEIKF